MSPPQSQRSDLKILSSDETEQLSSATLEALQEDLGQIPKATGLYRILLKKPIPLDPDQLEAVLAPDQNQTPLFVRAGPGSGKTSVLVSRFLIQLLRGRTIDEILAVTFTRRAAGEMKQRIQQKLKLCQEHSLNLKIANSLNQLESGTIHVQTFHSLALDLLSQTIPGTGRPILDHWEGNYGSQPEFLDSAELKEWIKDLQEQKAPAGSFSTESILRQIHSWKMNLISPPQASSQADTDLEFVSAQIYSGLRERKRREGLLDRFDLIYLLGLSARRDSRVRDFLKQRFSAILVDEFQDTNMAQQQLIRKLHAGEGTLFIVGDPYQSIFEWRGARPEGMKQFSTRCPSSNRLCLTRNYRSRGLITLAANELFLAEANYHPMKPARTIDQRIDYGSPPALFVAEDGDEEREFLRFSIEKEVENSSISYSDIAVLTRTNSYRETLRSSLLRQGIPVTEIGNREFFYRDTTRAFICALRWLKTVTNNQREPEFTSSQIESLLAWATHPVGPLDAERKDWLKRAVVADGWEELAEPRILSGTEKRRWKKSFRAFYKISQSLREGHYLGHSRGELSRLFYPSSDKTLEKYLNEARHWLRMNLRRDGLVGLNDLLQQFYLQKQESQQIDPEGSGVWLGTLHSVKGLEFPIVFIPGVEEGWLPYDHPQIDKPVDCMEERRLLYVGMTRAGDQLILSYARRRKIGKEIRRRSPSRFFNSIPDEFLKTRKPKFNFLSWLLSWVNPLT